MTKIKGHYYFTSFIFRSVVNNEHLVESDPTIVDEQYSALNAVVTDTIYNDDKRKLHHSDSLHLLRRKVKNEDVGISSDESLSSSLNEISENMLDGM